MLSTLFLSLRHSVFSDVGCLVPVLGLALLVADLAPSTARAQGRETDSVDLVQEYRSARYQLLVQRFLAERPMRMLPPQPIPTPLDSLRETGSSKKNGGDVTTEKPPFPVDDIRVVRRLERTWFQNQYGAKGWSFLGPSMQLTVLDTTRTRDLRARLQAQYGDPTYTPAEVDLKEWAREPDSSREGIVQFAYWFVVNDSIPVRVTDVNGPQERSLVVSTERTYRDQLPELRAALLDPLRREERAPYVDYFYEKETRRWYRTGYDGASFFRERIFFRDIVQGQRPRLDTVRTGPASSPLERRSDSSSL